ncbi:TPA: FUSC family protein [Pseudomonas aeruginosa]
MPIHWKPFLAPSTLALKFAIKTLLAGGLALWCAFRFDLEQPQWALMTVLIVSQPLSGMVVAKGLFRLLGTLVGTAMSVLMIALFAQAPWLFLLAISLWLGLCTAASTSLRNHVSYAFVLSGYTVAIIGLPAVDQPLLVFEQAVARCTEICLGIICASAVSAILWPQRVEQNLDKQAHATWLLGMQAARGEIDPRQRQPQGLLNALSKIVEVDAQRDHAWFEGERGRRRAGALALLGLSIYWIYTAWPAASGAMLLAAVVCSLFANRDNAVAIGLSFLRGIVYAIPAAMLVSQWLLPQWNGFPLLCLAMGVPLFFATLGMAVPVTAGTATSFAIHFIVLVAPRNQMDYDLATLLNSAQGVLIGVGFAVVIFRLLTLRPGWLTRRLLDATCVDLGRLTRRPLAQAENWFGGRMADRLLRLARHANLLPEQERRRWDDGLLALDLGNELIHLRACLEGARGVLRKARDRFLGELGELLEAGPAGPRSDRLERISLPLREALERDARHDDEASRLARAALAQLLFTWQQWCHQEESHESA